MGISISERALLAARLRDLRKSRGLTGSALAEKSGISMTSISNLENGLVHPTVLTLKKIASVYGLQVADLIPIELAPSDAKTWPDSFCRFVDSQVKIGEKLSNQDICDLLYVKFRDLRPASVDQWRALYLSMKGFGAS